MDAWRPGSCTSTWTSSSRPSRCSAAPSSPACRSSSAPAGDPTERGVVSTASYEARAFGVRSGMPLRTAVRRCPDAVVLPVDKPAYDAASAVVMDTLRAVPGAVVEVLGWDEAFVGVEADDPEAVARRIQADVLAATDLHCSVGIGDTKVRAKIATEFGKPRGTLPAHPRHLVRGDGGAADRGPVGRRAAHLAAAGRARRDDGSRAGRGARTPCWQRSSARRPGRGSGRWAVARAAPPSTTPRGCHGRTGGRRPTSSDLEPGEVGGGAAGARRPGRRRHPGRGPAVRAGAPQGAVRGRSSP